MKNGMNCARMIWRKGWIHPFLQITLVQNTQRGKGLNQFFPPNSSDDRCLFFYMLSLYTVCKWLLVATNTRPLLLLAWCCTGCCRASCPARRWSPHWSQRPIGTNLSKNINFKNSYSARWNAIFNKKFTKWRNSKKKALQECEKFFNLLIH